MWKKISVIWLEEPTGYLFITLGLILRTKGLFLISLLSGSREKELKLKECRNLPQQNLSCCLWHISLLFDSSFLFGQFNPSQIVFLASFEIAWLYLMNSMIIKLMRLAKRHFTNSTSAHFKCHIVCQECMFILLAIV